jgi:demethylmenaquinone methyltransferase/2-methoxy-6-polyprenyl-1,4-benzoquinol methylase
MSKNEMQVSRVTRSKEDARTSYDKLSRWYDMLVGHSEKKLRDAGLSKLGIKEGQSVLEIGFGTGHCIKALARSVGSSGKVFGIDISEGMLNIAQARVQKSGLSERVNLKCGDGADLPFDTALFDAIFMSFTLELFDTPEIPIVLRECQRVLRRSGCICIVAMSKKGKAGWLVRSYEWAHRKFPNYIDCRPIFVQKALKDSGFQVIDSIEKSLCGLPCEVVVARKTHLTL